MTVAGLLLGGVAGLGLVLVGSWLRAGPRHRIATRVLPYAGVAAVLPASRTRRRLVRAVAARVDAALGGATSVRRRLDRTGLMTTVADFRVEQVVWGLCCFAAAAALAVVVSLRSPGRVVPLFVLCLVAFAFGVMLRDNRLTAQVAARDRELLTQFPAVAELLALAVAAGESPTAAMERVASRGRGAMADELARVLGEVRTGVPLASALDGLAGRTGLPVVARFAEGLAVAVERGTPLADVLHAQAADVRESRRRSLIESGARREVLMMVPVVLLVMPTTVLFAFWPGLVGLHLVAP